MPTSQPALLTTICEDLAYNAPNIHSILDLGIGMGKYGYLAREYVDFYGPQNYHKDSWKLLLHGVEIFEDYRNPLWQFYDNVFIQNIKDFEPKLKYDLIIMIDVLEHFTKDEGLMILKKYQACANRMLVSYHNSEQGPVKGNQYEEHKSKWSPENFNGKPLLLADNWGLILL